VEEYLAINHMQRKLSTANPIHGALLGVAQVANENAKIILANPSAAQTISGQNLTISADLAVNGGDLTTSAATFNLLNATATTVNFAGAATALSLGAATGTATIKNASVVLDGDLQVKGGDVTTTATTFNLLNATATTVNFAGAATSLNLGAATGTATVNNANTIIKGNARIGGSTAPTNALDVTGAATVSGNFTVDSTTLHVDTTNNRVGVGTASPSVALEVVQNVAGNAAVNVANSSTDPAANARYILTNSATTGGLQIRSSGHASEASDTVLYSSANNLRFYTNGNLRATVASTGELTLQGDLAVGGGDLTTTATTFNLLNATATTVNFAGAATALNMGVAGGTVTVAGDLVVSGNDITSTKINKVTVTAPATGATLALADGSTLTTAGAFATTLTATAATSVTLPTTGTLATLAGTETLTNKTLTSPTLNSPSVGTQLTLGAASAKMATNAGVVISSATATLVDSFLNSDGSGGEYLIHASTSTGRTVVKLLVVLQGSTVETVEYGRVEVGTPISMTFAAAMNVNTMELKATCANAAAANVTVKTVRTLF
jgi:hypothetical protein